MIIYHVNMVRIETGWNTSLYIGTSQKKAHETYKQAASEKKYIRGRVEVWINGQFSGEEIIRF